MDWLRVSSEVWRRQSWMMEGLRDLRRVIRLQISQGSHSMAIWSFGMVLVMLFRQSGIVSRERDQCHDTWIAVASTANFSDENRLDP
jgi:RNase P/RNase MRP subunit POP5